MLDTYKVLAIFTGGMVVDGNIRNGRSRKEISSLGLLFGALWPLTFYKPIQKYIILPDLHPSVSFITEKSKDALPIEISNKLKTIPIEIWENNNCFLFVKDMNENKINKVNEEIPIISL